MAPVLPGTVFAGYRIEDVAGRGGMGIVYRARQLRPDRVVALKVIAPELAQNDEFRSRFERESEMAAAIEHPHVIPVYEVDEVQGQLYIAMRFVEGQDLRQSIELGIPAEHAVKLVDQVAGALDAAHARGLVHRDVKPANVLLSDSDGAGHAYLTDFGLTKRVSTRGGLTATGAFVGTIDYVAPEQIEGRPVDARADVYALACVLYHALAGSVPYPRDSDVATMWAHLNDPPPALGGRAGGASVRLDDVLQRGMAKAPDDRYPSAGDLARAASAALNQVPVAVPERTVAAGAAAPTVPAGKPPRGAREGQTPLTATRETVRLPRTRRRLWMSAVALGAVAAVAAVLVWALGSESEPEEPSPRVGELTGTVVPVRLAPTAIAADGGSAWVTSLGGTVTQVDRASGKAGRPIRVGKYPTAVAVGEGNVWVANGGDDDHPGDDTVVRIDPVTGHVVGEPIEVGDDPRDLAVGYSAVWVSNHGDDTVTRIDPDSGETVSIEVGQAPHDVAVGFGAVWTANYGGDSVTRISPASNEVLEADIPIGGRPESIVAGAGAVWVTNVDSDAVRELDPGTNQTAGSPIQVRERPDDLAIWNGGLYVANQHGNTIIRIDPRSRRVVGEPLRVGNGPNALAPDGNRLWVLNYGAQSAVLVRP
jgi:DNA-binding beta-propeller fold protein YncE